jgi:hypothetical protein
MSIKAELPPAAVRPRLAGLTSARLAGLGEAARSRVLIAAAGLLMLGLFLLVKDALIDDAYITLAYGKNMALHLHWGLIPQETSNTATSPLNVLLLAALTSLTRLAGDADAVLATGVLSVGAAMTVAWAWTRVARALDLPFAAAVAGVALVLVNPILLSAIGLELLLVAAVLMVLLAMAVEERPLAAGLVGGLALLCRVDLVVFVLALAVGTPALRRAWRPVLGGTALVAAPWFLVSWIALGSALPDSAVIKIWQRGLFGEFGYATGPVLYFQRYGDAITVAFLPAVLGLFALVAWLVVRTAVRWGPGEGPPRIGAAAALAGGGVGYYTVLSLLRLPPYHWYYVPPIVALSAFLVIAAGAWLRQAQARPRIRAAIPAGALALALLLALAALARDVGQGVPWHAPIVTTNFADASSYKRVGLALHDRVGSASVGTAGEIGTLAYYCDCAVVDLFSDRGRAVSMINERIRNSGPLQRLAYRLNFLWLDRKQKPRPLDYRLRYVHGPGSGAETYPLSSRWLGAGRLTLGPP